MSIDASALEILRCPVTGQRLELPTPDSELLITTDGQYRYPVVDGVFVMLPQDGASMTELRSTVKDFYDRFGWEKSKSGQYNDTEIFAASNDVPREYSSTCMLDVARNLPTSGKYLLDAGSGPIPHDEYMTYHRNFERRVCVDFSMTALLEARRKLGERGIYVLGDLTALPLADGTMHGAVCCHVLYHIPAIEQRKAMLEIARTLAPGGSAAVVYRWEDAPLSRRIGKVFRLLSRLAGASGATATHGSLGQHELYFHAHPRSWLLSQEWPFQYRLACFRLVDNLLMKRHMTDRRLWRWIAAMLVMWQRVMPRFTGKYGAYPIIVIEKSQ